MNIAYVSEGLAGGGSERQTVVLSNALGRCKEDTIYVITGVRAENDYRLSGNVNRCSILKGNRRLFTDALNLLRCAREYHFDVVIGMGIYANLLVAFTRLLGCKAKSIVSEMNDPVHDSLSHMSKLLRKMLYWRADGFVFQTNEEKEFYSKKIQKKGTVIHNPLMRDIPYKSDIRNKEIVAVGRLMPQKNYPLLLEAFRIVWEGHPEYRLKIFGIGLEEEKLRSLCRQLDIEENVIFEGFCIDVHEKMMDSDIYVMSSDYEGMPNALMEAMAMGFPVVSTDFHGGGAGELIKDGINGLLTPVGDAQKMAERIIQLIEDEELKVSIGRRAVEIREMLDEEKIAGMWNSYIHAIS